ncbi:hypothetical protein ACFC1R_12990 [Kitasatospora sp. NPDC056138]|uniref:hypothetical protein n=1 Tax=Kitasatospora sp. NPDC056138 TaxID=3345724 RepID=UPI0035DEEDED
MITAEKTSMEEEKRAEGKKKMGWKEAYEAMSVDLPEAECRGMSVRRFEVTPPTGMLTPARWRATSLP